VADASQAARGIDRDVSQSLASSQPHSASLRAYASTGLSAIPVVLLVTMLLSPVAMTLVGSFRISLPGEPNVWGLQGWIQAFTSPSIADAFVNTFVLAFMRVPLAIVIGALLAWLLIRTNLPGRSIIEFLFWISFFLPIFPVAMAWVLLLDPKAGWINRFLMGAFGTHDPIFSAYSYLGITWVHITATSVPVMIILLGPAFRALDPSMEESARMCGASRMAVFRRIVLPLLYPALMVAGIASFIRSLEAFEVELLLGTPAGIRVYATKIQELATWEPPRYAPSMALSVPFIALLFLLSLIHHRFLRNRNITTITGKATAGPLVDLGAWRLPLAVLCFIVVSVSVLVPAIALVMGSVMEVFGMARADGSLTFTLRHWQIVFSDTVFVRSVINTLQLAIGTALIGIFFYSMLAYILLRTRVPGRDVLAIVVWLPWAFPGILLSLSLLWMYLGTPLLAPLYGSMIGLIVAMLFKELPIGVNLMKSGLMQISTELEDAARMCGATTWQTYWRLVVPLLAPGAVAVGTICFIACIKDLSTMILLSTPETRPLSLLVLDYTTNGSLERGAVVGVIAAILAIGAALAGRYLGHRMNAGLGRI
jgi:iron(III) transport system permease protein